MRFREFSWARMGPGVVVNSLDSVQPFMISFPHMSLMRAFRILVLAASLGAGPVLVAQNATVGVPVRLAHAGGLQTSLSTGHFSVVPGQAESQSRAGGQRTPAVRATAAVVNRGRQAVPFGFASESVQRLGWYFRLVNAAGEQVWESEAQPETVTEAGTSGVTLMLRPGRSITRTVTVPMVLPEGGALAAGRYLLEAVLLSDMPLTASTVILVREADTRPGEDRRLGVIQGRAVHAERDENSTMPAAAGFRVTVVPAGRGVEPLRLNGSSREGSDAGTMVVRPPLRPTPPVWTGVTGENGEFRAEVPAGDYEVRVEFEGAVIAIYPPPPLPRGQAQVTVQAGRTTDTTIVLTLQHPEWWRAPVLSRFPEHWGPPPAIETKDIVELPGGYGQGSSTMRNWIQMNLDRDAAATGSGGR